MNAIVHADFDIVDDAGADFFAPVSSDLIDGLLGQYQATRKRIGEVGTYIASVNADVIHYFLEGNRTEERGRITLSASSAQLFDTAGAIRALNSAYWSKALGLTDVLDMMPQKRRDEWNEQITKQTAPDFEEDTVRSTISGLLAMRAQFLSERVDGIFRGLSGEHVTNAPEAFGKRMIVAYVLDSYGSSNYRQCGLINDLRCVIAKFMGRDEPKHTASYSLIPELKKQWGEWLTLDGGALRIRLYKKGTAHLEVHPDIAWRLNQILAFMHPTAIPAQFRQKPKSKVKDFTLMSRPLPFRALELLADVKPASRRLEPSWAEKWERIPNTVRMPFEASKRPGYDEACDVLRGLGGAGDGYHWTFDYDPLEVIANIVNTGCLPDKKAHQFYPTPAGLARRVAEAADLKPRHLVLEPSAGHGALVDAAMEVCGGLDITCVEASALNAKVLQAKGYVTYCEDFLKWSPGCVRYERVIMNPPFSEGRAEAHTRAAAEMVQAGGRLVAILPASMRNKLDLPGFKLEWSAPIENAFPGVSVTVTILTADRP